MKENEIFATQISLGMNGDTLEIYVDNMIYAEISNGRMDFEFAYEVLEGMGYEINEEDYMMRPMLPAERNYTYAQSQQISMQTGLIGYLRADMDSDGNGFFSTWNDFRPDLKTSTFKEEFDDVINNLREKDRILSNRSNLASYCYATPESSFGNEREYGVRVDTLKYSYLMRLNPHKGEYNLYCYCYQREWLDRHLEKAEKGIRFITPDYSEKFKIPDGDKIRITLNTDEKLDRVCRYIDDCHLEVGNNLYHICEFAEMMQRNGNTVIPLRSSLPEQCYIFLPTTREVGIVKKGESGYYKTDLADGVPSAMKNLVDSMNRKLGVSKAQAEAMKAGSMFGWDTPAADPKSYNENGFPIKPRKNKDYER